MPSRSCLEATRRLPYLPVPSRDRTRCLTYAPATRPDSRQPDHRRATLSAPQRAVLVGRLLLEGYWLTATDVARLTGMSARNARWLLSEVAHVTGATSLAPTDPYLKPYIYDALREDTLYRAGRLPNIWFRPPSSPTAFLRSPRAAIEEYLALYGAP